MRAVQQKKTIKRYYKQERIICTFKMPSTSVAWITGLMEQCTFKNVNNCLNTNIYSYLETSGGQSYNLYLNVVHFFNTSLN